KFGQSQQRRRAVRLFSCACCRRLWPFLPAESRASVEVAECFADGLVTTAELEQAHARADAAVLALPTGWTDEGVRLNHAPAAASDCTKASAATVLGALALAKRAADAIALDVAVKTAQSDFTSVRDAARATELNAQAELVREIFGNPYRTVRFSPDWRTD